MHRGTTLLVPRFLARQSDSHLPAQVSSVCQRQDPLADEGFADVERERILAEYDEIGFANTNSKSVLGSMNDLAFHYKYSILESGGVHSPAVPETIRRLNRMPMSAIKEVFPIC